MRDASGATATLATLPVAPEARDGGERVPRAGTFVQSAGLEEGSQSTLGKTNVSVWQVSALRNGRCPWPNSLQSLGGGGSRDRTR